MMGQKMRCSVLVALAILGLSTACAPRVQAAMDSGLYVCNQDGYSPNGCRGIAAFSHRDIVRGRYVVIHGWQGNSAKAIPYTISIYEVGQHTRRIAWQNDTLPSTGDVVYRIPLTYAAGSGRYTLRSMTEYRWSVVSKAGVRLTTTFVYTGTTNAHPILGGA